jgi:hypothetical protein
MFQPKIKPISFKILCFQFSLLVFISRLTHTHTHVTACSTCSDVTTVHLPPRSEECILVIETQCLAWGMGRFVKRRLRHTSQSQESFARAGKVQRISLSQGHSNFLPRHCVVSSAFALFPGHQASNVGWDICSLPQFFLTNPMSHTYWDHYLW